MERQNKSHVKWNVSILIISLLIVLIAVAGGIVILFHDELKIINSIEKISDEKPIYYMNVDGNYYFDDFLNSGGAASDKAVSAFLTKCISKGFYSIDVKESEIACSFDKPYSFLVQ